MRPLVTLLAIAALGAFASACGDGGSGGYGGSSDAGSSDTASSETAEDKGGDGSLIAARDAAETAAKRGPRIKVIGSDYGRVIADAKGEALYLFDREKKGRSECYGACAKAWPPFLARGGAPLAGSGADQKLLGTTRRRNGDLQVTYAGHPLYYYVHDTPGEILCHDVAEFGGLWLVVRPNGRPAP
jgi:predicted lipoprotein with Yx(FWY)xxD motif